MKGQKTIFNNFLHEDYPFEVEEHQAEGPDIEMGPWKLEKFKPPKVDHIDEAKRSQKKQYLEKSSHTIVHKENCKIIKKKQKFQTKSLQLGKCQIYEPMRTTAQKVFYLSKRKKDSNLPSIVKHQPVNNLTFNWAKTQNRTNEGNETFYKTNRGFDEMRKFISKNKGKEKTSVNFNKQQNKLLNTIESLIHKEGTHFNIYEKCVIQMRKQNLKEKRPQKYYFC